MNEKVSKTHDAGTMGNACEGPGVRARNAIDRLADNLELTFHRASQYGVGGVVSRTLALGHCLDKSCRGERIFEVLQTLGRDRVLRFAIATAGAFTNRAPHEIHRAAKTASVGLQIKAQPGSKVEIGAKLHQDVDVGPVKSKLGPVAEPSNTSRSAPRFGRCGYFLVLR